MELLARRKGLGSEARTWHYGGRYYEELFVLPYPPNTNGTK